MIPIFFIFQNLSTLKIAFLDGDQKTLRSRALPPALKLSFQQSTDGARMGDLAFAVIRLVIGFNVLEPVAVIHHQPG